MIIQPPATLLMGASGSGKTTAVVTYLERGIETFVLVTEPGGVESLLDAVADRKLDLSKLHWTSALPATQGWKGLMEMATKISTHDFESLAKIKSGIGKEDTRPAAMNFLNAIANFKCERDGKEYGDVTLWDDKRAFVVDSLSGLSQIAWALTVGNKPTAHQGEWSIAMNFINDIIMKIASDRRCFLTVTAHIEKEMNEITGVNQVMVSTLGKKLAPKLPRFFSELVMAKRTISGQTPTFTWSTCEATADLKNRALTIGDKLPPTFVPIVDKYHARLKAVGASAA